MRRSAPSGSVAGPHPRRDSFIADPLVRSRPCRRTGPRASARAGGPMPGGPRERVAPNMLGRYGHSPMSRPRQRAEPRRRAAPSPCRARPREQPPPRAPADPSKPPTREVRRVSLPGVLCAPRPAMSARRRTHGGAHPGEPRRPNPRRRRAGPWMGNPARRPPTAKQRRTGGRPADPPKTADKWRCAGFPFQGCCARRGQPCRPGGGPTAVRTQASPEDRIPAVGEPAPGRGTRRADRQPQSRDYIPLTSSSRRRSRSAAPWPPAPWAESP